LKASKVRSLQKKKADKNLINTELTALADSKEKYLAETGKVWSAEGVNLDTYYDEYTVRLYDSVTAQGNKVRELKKAKATKDAVDAEVAKLLALKASYLEVTGSDYRPPALDSKPTTTSTVLDKASTAIMSDEGKEIHEKIVEQGNKVRQLKADKSNSKEVQTVKKISHPENTAR
jgi:bifunctional glutamyl/prolyl-tRNA synthetase